MFSNGNGNNAGGEPDHDFQAVVPFFYNQRELTVITDGKGNPWWIGKEVCGELGYSKTSNAIQRHCKRPELLKSTVGGFLEVPPRGLLIINETDLYRLIGGSELPDVEPFKDWLYEEVIPSIRKTGKYQVAGAQADDIMTILKDPKRGRELLNHLYDKVEESNGIIENQTKRIEWLEPQAAAARRIAGTPPNTTTITEAAKELKISPRQLKPFLCKLHWIYRFQSSTDWIPYQPIVDKGYMFVNRIEYETKFGTIASKPQPRMTPKGITKVGYLIEKELEENGEIDLTEEIKLVYPKSKNAKNTKIKKLENQFSDPEPIQA